MQINRRKFIQIVGAISLFGVMSAGLEACQPTAVTSPSPSQTPGSTGASATPAPSATTEASPSAAPTTAPTTAGNVVNVEMKNIQFVPAQVTVAAGTTVVWTNKDSVAHTVDSGTRDNPTNLFKSGPINQGQTFSYTFSEAGTFPYFCEPHQSMNGTVIVTQ